MRKLIWLASVLLAGAVLYGVVGEVQASRNSGGTMSLYAPGNPAVANQTITSALWNNTFNDIANEITGSLSRNGYGAMLAPLKNVDGTKAAPAFTFNSESASGDYRAGTNDLRKSVNNTDVEKWTPTAVTAFVPYTFTGTAAEAPLIATPLAAPSAPSNGGLWVETTANVLRVRINGATKTPILSTGTSASLARADLPAVAPQVSTSTGPSQTTASGTYADITNLTVTFTTTGRPVILILQPDAAGTPPTGITMSTSAQTATVAFVDSVAGVLQEFTVQTISSAPQFTQQMIAIHSAPTAASHTYKIQAKTTGSATVTFSRYVLAAYEL